MATNNSQKFRILNKEDVSTIGPGKLVFISDLGDIENVSDNSFLFHATRVPALTIPVSTTYRTDRLFSAIYVDDRTVPYFFNVHTGQLDTYGTGWLLEVEI